MKIRFKTRTGSTYEISDTPKMTWQRVEVGQDTSGKIRAEHGELVQWPTIRVGRGAVLQDTSVQPGYDGHIVYTSDVTHVEVVAEDVLH